MGALALHSFVVLSPETIEILEIADFAICALFLVDFCLNLAYAENRTRYFLTWGWIDLLSSVPAVSALRWGRAARAVRILRVLRGVRATRLIAGAVLERRAQGVFLATLFVTLLLIVFASVAILQFEVVPDTNIKDAGDALWWAFVTITTVGYGDRYPVTGDGRVIGAVLMTAGVGLFGTFSGYVASWFLSPQREQQSEIAELRDEIRTLRDSLRPIVERELVGDHNQDV